MNKLLTLNYFAQGNACEWYGLPKKSERVAAPFSIPYSTDHAWFQLNDHPEVTLHTWWDVKIKKLTSSFINQKSKRFKQIADNTHRLPDDTDTVCLMIQTQTACWYRHRLPHRRRQCCDQCFVFYKLDPKLIKKQLGIFLFLSLCFTFHSYEQAPWSFFCLGFPLKIVESTHWQPGPSVRRCATRQ